MLGHVIVFSGQPETEWIQFEAHFNDLHVHIDQALLVATIMADHF